MEHMLTAELTAESIAALDDEQRAMLRTEIIETATAAAMDAGGVDAAMIAFAFKPDGSVAVMVDDDERVYSLADLAAMYEAMMMPEDEAPAEKPAEKPSEKPAAEAA